MKRTRVVISGAGGFVGRNVGRMLAGWGFEVTALSRKARVPFGNTVLTRDLSERGLERSLWGAAAFVHLVGVGRQDACSDYGHVNVTLTKNALALCRRAGIKKFVYLSGLGVSKDSTLGYFISKYRAEREIAGSGLDYTIFRPSYIMGGGDPLSTMLRRQAASGRVSIPGSGRYRLQPILVDDVARAIMAAVSGRRLSRKTLDLVGPRAVTYARLVRDLAGGARIVHLDFEKAYHDALLDPGSQFGVDDLALLVGDFVGDHGRLARVSGLEFSGYGRILESCRLA